ncbi:unnamed protein product [Prunus armeniaca]|uniref:Uncharacterized protein n=1 Tax=Prunus armeniaca TaxID=36596 RepID=A0A6J5VK24_PRUAR|nr:unnamed protein product [Prunus armeniaca]
MENPKNNEGEHLKGEEARSGKKMIVLKIMMGSKMSVKIVAAVQAAPPHIRFLLVALLHETLDHIHQAQRAQLELARPTAVVEAVLVEIRLLDANSTAAKLLNTFMNGRLSRDLATGLTASNLVASSRLMRKSIGGIFIGKGMIGAIKFTERKKMSLSQNLRSSKTSIFSISTRLKIVLEFPSEKNYTKFEL